jgi:hypothetical protein
MAEEDDDAQLSPQDIEKLRTASGYISQSLALLNDIPEDVRETCGELDDAISKLEEADDLIGTYMSPAEASASADDDGA